MLCVRVPEKKIPHAYFVCLSCNGNSDLSHSYQQLTQFHLSNPLIVLRMCFHFFPSAALYQTTNESEKIQTSAFCKANMISRADAMRLFASGGGWHVMCKKKLTYKGSLFFFLISRSVPYYLRLRCSTG